MSKKFLERLGDAFGDDELDDLLPTRKRESARTTHKRSTSTPPTERSKPSHRKKFIKNIEQALDQKVPFNNKLKRDKTFLEAMEGALEDQAFDNIFPKKSVRQAEQPVSDDETYVQFQTLISLKVFNRAKEIAIQKGIRIKDVINIALKWYLDHEHTT